MEHRLIKEVADLYGIEEALLFKYLSYNVLKNERLNRYFKDEKYWLSTTIKFLKEKVFTYMTERQIAYTINHLKKEGLITTKIDGKMKTTWYSITQKGFKLLNEVNDKIVNHSIGSDLQNCKSVGAVNDKIVNHSYIIYTNKKYILNNKLKRYFKLESDKNQAPTLKEIESFIKERKSPVNAQRFFDYYSVNNWKDKNGVDILSNWKQRVISWEKDEKKPVKERQKNFIGREYSEVDINNCYQSIDDIDI